MPLQQLLPTRLFPAYRLPLTLKSLPGFLVESAAPMIITLTIAPQKSASTAAKPSLKDEETTEASDVREEAKGQSKIPISPSKSQK